MQATRAAVVLLLLAACGEPPPTQLSVVQTTATQDVDANTVTLEVEIRANGRVRFADGDVLLGSTKIGSLSQWSRNGENEVLKAEVRTEELLSPTDAAPVGGKVPVKVTLRVRAEDLTANSTADLNVGCGSARAICAGACADLTKDAKHCGACGNACNLQLTSSVYAGRCQQSRCLWPGLTVTGTTDSCASICAGSQFKSKPLACTASCAYIETFSSGHPSDDPGSNAGAVRYFNGIKVTSSCSLVPTDRDTQLGSFQFQMCCCEAGR